MNSKHRFNRDEISKILKRAAELEHQHDVDDDSEGLTVEELKQVSQEVGLHPKYIRLAIDELDRPEPPTASGLLGGPFKYQHSELTGGVISNDQWEDVVSEIRRIDGGIGKTSKLGRTFEWEQRKQEVGYIQISLAPKNNQTEININANYSHFAFVVSLLTGMSCILLFMFLANEFSSSPAAEILVFGPILVLLIGVRFYLSSWMKKKRRTYRKLFNRLKGIIGSENISELKQQTTSPSIKFPSEVEGNEKSTGLPNRQKTS